MAGDTFPKLKSCKTLFLTTKAFNEELDFGGPRNCTSYTLSPVYFTQVYSTLWIFLEGDTSSVNPADGYAFTYVMLVCMCIGLIASIGYHILVKFPDSHKKGNQDEDTSSNNTSVDWSWFREYQLYQIGFVYMATRLYVNLAQAYIPFFLQVNIIKLMDFCLYFRH